MPADAKSVDVFLVGGGGGVFDLSAGGGRFTKTLKKDTSGWQSDEASIEIEADKTAGVSIKKEYGIMVARV